MSETSSISYWTAPKMIIRLVYASNKIRQPEDFVGYHSHPAHELLLVKSGSLLLRHKNQQWFLGENTFFAIPASKRHSIVYQEKNTRTINIMFRGNLFDQLIFNPTPLRQDELEMAELVVASAAPPFEVVRAELTVARLVSLLCMLTLRLDLETPMPVRVPVNRKLYKSKIVLEAVEYIEKHSCGPLALSTLAKHVGISPSYLRHLLLQETGCGFTAHLLQNRVEKAKQMIAGSDASVKNIASDCGFNSIAFFYKTFKRFTGMTPLEYAKSLR
jgi:AraC-like DNA-binding protein